MLKRSRKLKTALILVAAMLVIVLTRSLWVGSLVKLVGPSLARRYGVEVEVERVSGNGTDRIELTGVRLRALGEKGALRSLDAKRLRVDFDWLALLRGEPGALHKTLADQLEVELDFRREALEESEADTEPVERRGAALELPELDISDAKLTVTLENEALIRCDDLNLGLEKDGESIVVRAGALAYRDSEVEFPPAPLQAELSLSTDRLRIHSLDWGEALQARESQVQWGFEPDSVETAQLAWDASLLLFGASAKLSGQLSALPSEPNSRTESAEIVQLAIELKRLDLAKLDALFVDDPGLVGFLEELAGTLRLDLSQADRSTGRLHTHLRALAIEGTEAFDLNGEITLEDGFLRADEIEFSSENNRLIASDVELPLQLGSLSEQLQRGRFDLTLDARNIPGLIGRTEANALVREHHLGLTASLDSGIGQITRGQLTTQGGTLTVRSGSVRTQPTSLPKLVLDMYADFHDLESLGELIDDREWAGNLAGQVQVQGTWPDLSAIADLRGEQTRIAGIDLGELQVRLEADRDRILFPEVVSRSGGNELYLEGALVMKGDRPHIKDLRFDLDVSQLEQLLPGLNAAGSARVRGQASGAVGELKGEWSLIAENLRVEDHIIDRLEGRGTLQAERVQILELRAASHAGVAQLVGELELDEQFGTTALELTELSLERSEFELALVRPTRFEFDQPWPNFRALELSGDAGSLSLYCRPESRDALTGEPTDALYFGARFDEFTPTAFLEPFLPDGFSVARLNGALDVSIVDQEFGFTSTMEVEKFTLPLGELTGTEFDHPWNLNWNATHANGRLALESFEAKSGGTSHLTLHGEVPFAPLENQILGEGALLIQGELSLPNLEAFAPLVPQNTPWPSGRIELALNLSGDWKTPSGTIDINADRIDLDENGTSLIRNALIGGRVRLGEKTELSRIRVQIPDALSIGGDGELSAALDLRSLVRGEAPFSRSTPIRFSGGIIVNDSTWIDRLHRALGGEFFRRLGGQLAATLELTGTLAEPNPKGQLELSGGTLKLSPELPTIEKVAGVLKLDGTRFDVEQLSGQFGGEPFELAGFVSLDEQDPALDLTLSGDNLLLYRSSGVKFRSNANLRVSGTPAAPHVSGELRLTDGRFVKRFDFLALGRGGGSLQSDRAISLFSFRDAPLADTTFDVAITSAEPFRIDNNVVKARVRPDLQLSGTGESPQLLGELYIDGGRVALPANDLFLRQGTITLNRSSSMIPQLELLLENRLRGYDVSVTITGPYDEPEVSFSSSPPLSPEDLAALVWAGQDPGEGLTSRTGLSGAQAVGAYIAQDLLTRLFTDESTESDESFFDRFELFLGRDTTEDGGETIEMTYRLSDEVFGESDSMYLATEKDIYSHVNFGLRFVFRFE